MVETTEQKRREMSHVQNRDNSRSCRFQEFDVRCTDVGVPWEVGRLGPLGEHTWHP